jgi:uncharacterized protein
MKRIIDVYLLQWKNSKHRKPLLLRGARQVGKTHAVRTLAPTFQNYVEINLEQMLEAHRAFEQNLDPVTMIEMLAWAAKKPIIPGSTLLFLDEIQAVPRAIIALRYFYENMPELHVIAAGSLLNIAIQEVGMPVGRIEFLHMYPVSFLEFLVATGNGFIAHKMLEHPLHQAFPESTHHMLLDLVAKYLALGGMPEVIANWIETPDPDECTRIHKSILYTYRQDFSKYARQNQIKYLELVFRHIPRQFGQKFKYSAIEGDYRKRELAPALDLLETVDVVHKVMRSAGQGIPLGAQVDFDFYKVIFLDIGLAQSLQGLDLREWFLSGQQALVNKGALVEAFVGQEILAYAQPYQDAHLYYWQRDEKGSEAEVDYLIQDREHIIPIEVKSGSGSTLKSMQLFLTTHQNTPYGLRFSTQNFSEYNKVCSYPLYAIGTVLIKEKELILNALQ